ncbi:MAG: ABC transporter permease [Oscillospiraceae bacterium]|nr:ABC transporter permease [Oscillospiraceae bacterium]
MNKQKALRRVLTVGKAVGRQLLLILAAMLVCSLFLLCTGYDPFIVLKAIGRAIRSDLGGTVRWTTPYMLTGLAVAVTFRANIFNMGVDGQLYLGSIAAVWLSTYLTNWPAAVAVPFVLVFSMLVGGLYAVIPALLKIRLRCDEVVTTLLLNYVAFYFTDYLVLGPMLGSGTLTAAHSTEYISENLWLPKLGWFGDSNANFSLFIGLLIVALITFMLYKTRYGYEIKVCGANMEFARYGGISAGKTILFVMIVSGMIGGATGAMEILGVHHRFAYRYSTDVGMDGVVVALLAGNNPIGVILSGFFYGALKNGASIMQRIADVPSSLVDVVRGSIVLIITADFGFRRLRARRRARRAAESRGKEAA